MRLRISGKAPENVHFEALKRDIAQLFAEQGPLAPCEAYDKAVWLNLTSGARPSRLSGRQKRSGPRRPPPNRRKASERQNRVRPPPGKPTSMRGPWPLPGTA